MRPMTDREDDAVSDGRKWVADLYDEGNHFVGTVIVGDALGASIETSETCRTIYRITDMDVENRRVEAVVEKRERVR
jgi:hypothetical protein